MITTLSELIKAAESGGHRHAIRFEPGFAKYITESSVDRAIAGAAPCTLSRATARNLLQTSFGFYQIMGENIYALGYRGNILDWINSDEAQFATFVKYCLSRGISFSLQEILNDPNKRAIFAKKYNGDAVAYSAHLLATYEKAKGK